MRRFIQTHLADNERRPIAVVKVHSVTDVLADDLDGLAHASTLPYRRRFLTA